MKKYFIWALVFVPMLTFSQIESGKLQASGLTCSMCNNAIYKSLSKLEFVEKVTSDIETSTFELVFKKESIVDAERLQKAVAQAGFSVSKLILIATFDHVNIVPGKENALFGTYFYFHPATPKTLQGKQSMEFLDKEFVSPKVYKKLRYTLYSESQNRVYNVAI